MIVNRSAWAWIIGVFGVLALVGGGIWAMDIVGRAADEIHERSIRDAVRKMTDDRTTRAIPGEIDGWQYVPMSATGPTLYRLSNPRMFISCTGMDLSFNFAGFDPAQAWPQPAASVHLGAGTFSHPPGLQWADGKTAFEMRFPLSSKMLTPLRRGEALSIEFRGKQLQPPTLPVPMREAFADNCGTRILPGG